MAMYPMKYQISRRATSFSQNSNLCQHTGPREVQHLLINPFAMLSSPIPSFTVRTCPLSLPMLGAQEAVPQLPPASFRTIFFVEFIFKILPKVEVMEDFMKSILFKRSCTYTVRNHLYFGTALNCGGSLN